MAENTGLLGKAMPGQEQGKTEPMGSMNPGKPRQQQADAGGEDEPNVSPEEQAAFDQFMNNAYKIIYDDGIAQKMLKSIQDAEDPKSALAMSAVNIVSTLEEKAQASGAVISADVLMHGGITVVEDIANFANVAGAHEFSVQDIEEAILAAMDLYGDMALEKGTVDEEGVKQSYNEMIAANEQGRLDDVLPNATEAAKYAEKFGKPEGMTNGRG